MSICPRTPLQSCAGGSRGKGVERSCPCPRHRGRAAAHGPRPPRPRGRATRTAHSEHHHGHRPEHGVERPPRTPGPAPPGGLAEHVPKRLVRRPGGDPRSGPGEWRARCSQHTACSSPGRRPGARRCVPTPGLEPGNSAADIPESGLVPRTSTVGSVGLALPSPARPVRAWWGDHTGLQPVSATRGRAGYSWAVQSPRALPHDLCGHPERVVHGQSCW